MMTLQENAAFQLIGNTPLTRISSLSNNQNVKVFAKLESYNPTGSIKDRIVKYMLDKALASGKLKNIDMVVEASSGNTMASLAMLAPHYGLNVMVFTPDKTSEEKVALAELYGAKVVLAPEDKNYIDRAYLYALENQSCYLLNQYNCLWNREAHYFGLGAEIFKQLDGKIDMFVSVGSTGGTISGVAKYLKQKNPDIKIILADPIGSAYYAAYYNKTYSVASHTSKIEGAGKSDVMENMDLSLVDDVITFDDQDAVNMAYELVEKEGLCVGFSSGANAFIAKAMSKKIKGSGNIVTIFPDTGLKYLKNLKKPLTFG